MESLNKYKKVRDTKELLITIIVFDHTKDNLLSFLSHRLELIKNIKDTFKRKKANDRVYNLKNILLLMVELAKTLLLPFLKV